MKNLAVLFLVTMQSYIANAQWYQVNSSVTEEKLNDVVMVDENTGFCVGGFNQSSTNPAGNGIILKTTDGGENWEIIYNNPDIVSFSYIMAANNEIIALGGASGANYIFKSIDEGENWTVSDFEYTVLNAQSSNNKIYFVDGFALREMTSTEVITLAENVAIFGVNNNDIAYINTGFDTIYKSEDSGETFYALEGYPEEFSQNQSTQSVIKPFGDTIVVHYTYPNATQYSTDNGVTWIHQYDNLTANYCEIITSNLLMGSPKFDLNIQKDYQPWENQATFENEIRKIYVYDENLGFAVGDNGMIYKTTEVNLSTDKVLEKRIKIMPNPTSDILLLTNTENINITSLDLFDLSGKKIKSFPNNAQQLDISDLSSGTYLLNISTESTSYSEKIVKK